ncbi:unnamed protein product [Lactuca virosa]|uniref:Uncharacterized protein n=1 Tax=Lactuca virosa TaxID=75947 RepID=A0AAU9MQY7_9ASTR|nr:unnamed protein product [Lactuca virosa]
MWANLSSWMPRREVAPQSAGENSRFPGRGRTLGATQTETVSSNASPDSTLQTRLLESGNSPVHPSTQEAIARNDRRQGGINTDATAAVSVVSDEDIQKVVVMGFDKISEESTGPPPTDEMSIEEESTWILHQLQTGVVLFGRGGDRTTEEGHGLVIVKDDIMRFLEFMHVQKLDVPFITMYRKEECMSIFKDPEAQDDKESEKKSEKKPTLRWR